jgi:hypothetical protein
VGFDGLTDREDSDRTKENPGGVHVFFYFESDSVAELGTAQVLECSSSPADKSLKSVG